MPNYSNINLLDPLFVVENCLWLCLVYHFLNISKYILIIVCIILKFRTVCFIFLLIWVTFIFFLVAQKIIRVHHECLLQLLEVRCIQLCIKQIKIHISYWDFVQQFPYKLMLGWITVERRLSETWLTERPVNRTRSREWHLNFAPCTAGFPHAIAIAISTPLPAKSGLPNTFMKAKFKFGCQALQEFRKRPQALDSLPRAA